MTLFNFEPLASNEEIEASVIQLAWKLNRCTKPSKFKEVAFENAVEGVTRAVRSFINLLETAAEPRDDEDEALKCRAHSDPTLRLGRVHWPVGGLQRASFMIY